MGQPLDHASVAGVPKVLLRLEGMALLALATAVYGFMDLSWWLYVALFFAPDVSFAAYGAGPRLGAMVYNALHSMVGPALLVGVGFLADSPILLGGAAIWAAHIGFDRMLGYGLKYGTGFNDTHLGRIGRAQAGA
ncbi:hypothetical protein MAE02_36290 [Microvirga aerophila]|uniref:DUF4260 domain-containing protein n=1 Tax=Microvirga aerophila TaxID=670291 RepID=A0A512BVG3_9HYPH|nr:DUF4260 domain-containing protein [Microvirga aerophila]GEO15933.1 hypothetical protein MAE02_36290 [Microvirga aerophila]